MTVCPLCEHAQPGGDACEVCGRPLEAAGGETVDVPALDGLEPTRHAAAAAPGDSRLDGLEPTALPGDLAEVAPEPLGELEPTGAAPVEVQVAPAPDLEPTALAPAGDGPTPLAAVPTCRYCRTPALPGERRCGRCGMRLPVPLSAAREGDGARPEPRRCSCGAPVSGASCPACGARVTAVLEG